ncbi:DinB family protein [Laceyella sacchari]|jgi:uncharacterized damage-inducible protein DinB|uniref:DinB family protein n=1 Tax=Laceyella sacchari TaxID=37482 RepID=A0ABY5U0R9_LACSH|nr:DinB family protein [Laceyella sacchari]TCW38917.1 putative damage-inducible protein DinB [Laceyella sacchari]UWE03253.1 DinB family protein [Laceyella sacchari]
MSKANGFVNSWLRHRLVLLELLEHLQDEHLDYRPWEKGMSLKELVLHILQSADMFVNSVIAGHFVSPAEPEKAVNTVAELRELAQALTDKNRQSLSSLPDEKFAAMVDVTKPFGRPFSGEVLLQMMRDHEIHHKGQLYTYARIVGVETLPLFVKLQLD